MGREPIRILRIITRLNAGGPSRHVSILSAGLDPERFQQLLVHGALHEGESPIHPWPQGRLESVGALQRPLSPRRDRAAFRELERIARDFRPQIIHSHQAKAGVMGRLLPSPARRVHTFHGHTFAGYWNGLGNRLVKSTEKRLARRSDALIAQSEQQEAEVRQALGDPKGLRIVEPAVDFDLVAQRRDDPVPGELVRPGIERIGFVSRIAPVKDLHAFLEALAPWLREEPHRRQLVIAGRGSSEHEEEARAHAKVLGIDRSLLWLGHVEHPASVFARLDLVVLSSRNEGTPLALIEALVCGARVAAYDHGGIVDTIGADPRVRLAQRGNPRALERAAREALELRVSEAERDRADAHLRERFGAGRLLGDMAQLYEELVARD